jgi:hypothetical protein
MSSHVAPPSPSSRLGEVMVASCALPGVIAAAALGIGLAFDRLGWQPNPSPLLYPLAWAAILSPALVLVGTFTLVAGAVIASVGPGRRRLKLALLIAGTLSWGLACYWLSVPGLIQLP